MAIAGVHMSIMTLINMRNILTEQLTKITQRRQNITYQMTDLITADWSKDPQVKLLQLQDNDLDMQQKKMETDLKAITANLESQQKLEDNNIKKDFGTSLSL